MNTYRIGIEGLSQTINFKKLMALMRLNLIRDAEDVISEETVYNDTKGHRAEHRTGRMPEDGVEQSIRGEQ